MSISVVQSKTADALSTSITSLSLALSSSTTAGNTLVVAVSFIAGSTGVTVSGITLGGSAGNFAKAVGSGNPHGLDAEIWCDPNCAGGDTSVVISFTGGNATDAFAWAYEVSGLASSPVDKSSSGAPSGEGDWSSGTTATTSQATEIWFGVAVGEDAASPSSPSGWTNTALNGSGEEWGQAGYQIVSSTGTATYSGTPSVYYAAAVVTLEGSLAVTTSGSLSMASMSMAATAGENFAASGSLSMDSLALDGSALAGNIGTSSFGMTGSGGYETIAEDASTPAVVTGSAVASLTTAEFSPPAGVLLVAIASWGNNDMSSPSLAVSDSLSGEWTAGPALYYGSYQMGAIFYKYQSSAETNMTVTCTGTGFTQASPAFAVRVLTGAAADQSAAASATNGSTAANGDITTTTAGSWVYVAASGYPLGTSGTAESGTTQIESFYPAETDVLDLIGRQTDATVTPGSTLLGWTNSGGATAWVAQEILPAAGAPSGFAMSGTGTVAANNATGGLTFSSWSMDGSALAGVVGSGGLSMSKMGMQGTDIEDFNATGGLSLSGMKMAATCLGGNTTTSGGVTIAGWTMAAECEGGNTTSSGSLSMDSMALAGAGIIPFFPLYPLPLSIEILLNGTWTDITSFIYQRNPIVITTGRPDESSQVNPSQMTLTLNNRDSRFTPGNTAGAYFPYITRNIQIRVYVQAVSPAGYVYDGYRFWGEIESIPPASDISATDVYVSITAAGLFQRLSQANQSTIGSPLRRYYLNLSGDEAPIAAWSCEDGSGSTQFGSMVSDGDAMTWTGTPSLSSDTGIPGSDALPQMNGSVWTGDTPDYGSSGDDVYTTPGTYVWYAPGGLTEVDCRVWGAAGGGADGQAGAAGGGGGGGEFAEESTLAIVPGTGYSLTVGAGGADNEPGAASSFTGASKTVTAHGGGAGSGSAAGAGGTGSSNATHHNGGAGSPGGGSSGDYEENSFITTAVGADYWEAPSDLYGGEVTAYIWAGGGGGGGGVGAGSPAAGGGGAGGNFNYYVFAVTAGNSYSYTVGSGGTGSAGDSGDNGTQGNASQFVGDSTTLTVHGGDAGLYGGNGGTGGSHASDSGGYGLAYGGDGGGLGGVDGGGGGGAGALGGDGADGHVTGGGTGGGSGGLDVGGGNGGNGGVYGGAGQAGAAPGGGGAGGSKGSYAGANGHGGRIELYWTEETSDPTVGPGGGGGSSAGTSAAGNGGSAPVGGIAPAGGGSGGSGGTGANGSAGSQPGGGGGGGDAAGSPNYIGGNGAAGTVQLLYTPSSTPASNVLRFVLDVPAAGGTSGAIYAQMYTGGTVAKVNVVYGTGGTLTITGYNSGGSSLFSATSGDIANGQPMMVSVELTTSGSSVAWAFRYLTPGGSVTTVSSGTVSGSVGNVSEVIVNSGGTETGAVGAGWFTVQYVLVALSGLSQPLNAYIGELAATRFERICTEEGFAYELLGSVDDTPEMGAQLDEALMTVLQEIEDLDRGLLYESRDQFGLGYRTRVNMQNQSAQAVMDYSVQQLAVALSPTYDTLLVRNQVTLTRTNGGTVTVTQETGDLSVQNPPNGVGPGYSYSLTVNGYEDSQLANEAAWILTVGTVDEERLPTCTIDMARSESAALFADVPALNFGDYFVVANPPSWFNGGSNSSQLLYGYTETFGPFGIWTIAPNAVPEDPYTGDDLPTW